jgi:hypothetical protein
LAKIVGVCDAKCPFDEAERVRAEARNFSPNGRIDSLAVFLRK